MWEEFCTFQTLAIDVDLDKGHHAQRFLQTFGSTAGPPSFPATMFPVPATSSTARAISAAAASSAAAPHLSPDAASAPPAAPSREFANEHERLCIEALLRLRLPGLVE